MIASMELSGKSDARGWNGWFKPTRIDMWAGGNRLFIEVMSKRSSSTSPIILELTPEDAEVVASFIRGRIAPKERHIFCPECSSVVPFTQETTTLAEYGPCPQCEVYWLYNADEGSYSSTRQPTNIAGFKCPNCSDGCTARRYCDGCHAVLCQGCYDEHNSDAPCHVGG